MKADEPLGASLRRIADVLEQSRVRYAAMAEQIAANRNAEAAERIATVAARIEERVIDRHQRRRERQQRRDERRRRAEDAGGELSRGVVFAVMAIVCLVLAVRQPTFFWMVFVALGFGMSAASSFERAARRKRLAQDVPEEAETERDAVGTRVPAAQAEAAIPAAPPVEPQDPKVLRIQNLCDKLLAEVESGPPIVREVVAEPHATIGGLREACVQTARRERALRSVLEAQDEAALLAERDALAARVSSERDAIVRERLGQALRALEQQLAHRAELVTAATRLEAENTRILYTLENLHMQLLRARSTDIGAPELGGKLRESLRDLGTQIDAVAEALEWASAPGEPTAPSEAASASPAAATRAAEPNAELADAQRAEREAAARRARAQQAQRQ